DAAGLGTGAPGGGRAGHPDGAFRRFRHHLPARRLARGREGRAPAPGGAARGRHRDGPPPGVDTLAEMLEVGQKAPDFEVLSTSGEQFHLADALGKHAATVILFYVLDFTPG